MQRWKNIVFNISLSLNCLLLFFLFFEKRLVFPPWLQVAGRMHPLLLHFPIVLVVIFALAKIFYPQQKEATKAELFEIDSILLFATLTASCTALMGFILSREPGYDAETLLGHKWSGVALSFILLGWYYARKMPALAKIGTLSIAVVSLCLVMITGHWGANITHGEDFLLAPVKKEKAQTIVAFNDALVFEHMVKPILESKCINCHNSKKAKGQLVMETTASLLTGGKSGALWDSTREDFGLMLQRLHLPTGQKKHMPPLGKPQLTDEELEIISQWVRKGSSFKLKVAALPATDPLRLMAANIFNSGETETYDFDEASGSTIEQLNSMNCVVAPVALNSPGLSVSYFVTKFFNANQLKDLLKIKKQVVSLDLAKMPVKDEDLKTISQLENLRKLNLNFTDITGSSISELAKLKTLRSLSLSGTKVTAAQLGQLGSLKQLQTIYLWNTPLSSADLKKLKQTFKKTTIETGFSGGDTTILKLSPPILQNDVAIISQPVELKLKHYVKGVTIKYSTDGTSPDSLLSPTYKPGILINSNATFKAKAFKPGWISSDSIEFSFFKNTYQVDSGMLLTPPDQSYKGEAKMLFDGQKGSTNFRLGNWLAWRETRMEVMVQLKQAQLVKSITLSSLVDAGSHIMAPSYIEIRGGIDRNNLKLLAKLTPDQGREVKPAFLKPFECAFTPTSIKYIQVMAMPLNKLPSWHPQKGAKAWFFIDEVLIN